MLVRELTNKDINKIVLIEEELFNKPWTYNDFYNDINNNPFSKYYILDKNDIIGYIGLWVDDNMTITNIGISKDMQHHGYSQLLMNEAIKVAIENNCQYITLEVRVSNIIAINLYKKNDFKIKAIRKNYYQDNFEDAYLMVKEV